MLILLCWAFQNTYAASVTYCRHGHAELCSAAFERTERLNSVQDRDLCDPDLGFVCGAACVHDGA